MPNKLYLDEKYARMLELIEELNGIAEGTFFVEDYLQFKKRLNRVEDFVRGEQGRRERELRYKTIFGVLREAQEDSE